MNRYLDTYDAAEQRNKLSHFTVQGFDINGVIQAGANDGEEIENFIRMGVENLVAFEPHPKAFKTLLKSYKLKCRCFQVGLDEYDGEGILKVAPGDGKSSSMFDMVDPPDNYDTEDYLITVMRFDTWANTCANKDSYEYVGIDLSLFDTLQLDTQGNEMEILKGIGKYLQDFKFLCVELSTIPIYVGETSGLEVAEWLAGQGFILDSPIYSHNDAFFIRSDIKSHSDRVYLGRA